MTTSVRVILSSCFLEISLLTSSILGSWLTDTSNMSIGRGFFFTDTWCLFSTHRPSRDIQCIMLPTRFHESRSVPSGVHTDLHLTSRPKFSIRCIVHTRHRKANLPVQICCVVIDEMSKNITISSASSLVKICVQLYTSHDVLSLLFDSGLRIHMRDVEWF